MFLPVSLQCVETLPCWRTTVSLIPFRNKRVSVVHSSPSQPTCFFAISQSSHFFESGVTSRSSGSIVPADKSVIAVVSASRLAHAAFPLKVLLLLVFQNGGEQ